MFFTKAKQICWQWCLCLLLWGLTNISINAHSDKYFKIVNYQKIKIPSQQEQIALWKDTETPTIYRQFNIQKQEDIKFYVKHFHDIELNHINQEPSYNKGYDNNLSYTLKQPDDKLVGVYLHPRDNPFNITYQATNDKHTVDDLKPQTIAIDTFNEFFDVNKMPLPQVKIHDIIHQFKDSQEIINFMKAYLLKKQIITDAINIKHQCYNRFQNGDMNNKLPKDLIDKNLISGIYFDKGVRILTNPNTNIMDCQKLANGAKNIYVFRELDNVNDDPNQIINPNSDDDNNAYNNNPFDNVSKSNLNDNDESHKQHLNTNDNDGYQQKPTNNNDDKNNVTPTFNNENNKLSNIDNEVEIIEYEFDNINGAISKLIELNHNLLEDDNDDNFVNNPMFVDYLINDDFKSPLMALFIHPHELPNWKEYRESNKDITLETLQTMPQLIKTIHFFKKSASWLKETQEWLNKQPDVKIHEYTIDNREEGYLILEQNGINIYMRLSSSSNSMNDSYDNRIRDDFNKTNNENVDFIYCVPRDNSFSKYYKTNQTLDYYKQQKGTIKDLYIFYMRRFQIHEYTIDNAEQMNTILQKQGLKQQYDYLKNHLCFDDIENNLDSIDIVNPPSNLAGVYIIPRTGYCMELESGTYTLDNLKTMPDKISRLYIFYYSPIKIHEYTIDNRQEGYKILEQNGIKNNNHRSFNDSCSMNHSGNYYLSGNFNKTNNENVDFIYCVKRNNKSYLTGQTLDYYKNREEIISDLFIFKRPLIEIKEYVIANRDEGLKILEQNGINGVLGQQSDFNEPNLNNLSIAWRLKDKPDNVDFIYLMPKPNKTYQYGDNTDTIEDFKKQTENIKTIYIFYKKPVNIIYKTINEREEGLDFLNKVVFKGQKNIKGLAYNYNAPHSDHIYYELKPSKMSKNVDFIYIEAKPNQHYLYDDYQFTLEDFINQPDKIANIYVFIKSKNYIEPILLYFYNGMTTDDDKPPYYY